MSGEGGHGYFRAIEETFIRLRGAPLLLSPADYQVAKAWFEAGIPLDLVCRTLQELFDRQAERAEGRAIQSLKYCRRPVEQAWQEQRSLSAAGAKRLAEEIPVAARLQRLAAALPESLPDRRRIAERILALEGPVDLVESRLSELDGEALDRALAEIDDDTRGEVTSEALRALAALEQRIPEGQREAIRQRLIQRALRRRLNLPLLSLFAPEAVEPHE